MPEDKPKARKNKRASNRVGNAATKTNSQPVRRSEQEARPLPRLPLADMATRHTGLTEEVSSCYLQAARVCLDRHHILVFYQFKQLMGAPTQWFL